MVLTKLSQQMLHRHAVAQFPLRKNQQIQPLICLPVNQPEDVKQQTFGILQDASSYE